MIEQLMVKDYILFDQANIDFQNNMSVITGETGAGKSLLIDAIGCLSGDRLSGSVVRKGARQAVLEMVLSNPSDEVRQMLEENGFDESDTIIITRIIQANGKSRMLLNSRTTTNAFIKQLVSRMVDVHSQMDTITLMDPAVQMEMLDRYARNEELKQQTALCWKQYQEVARKLKKLKTETFSDAELEFVTAQLNEIDAASLKAGELEELEEKIQVASGVEKSMEDYADALYAWKKEGGIQELLYNTIRRLKRNTQALDQGEKLNDLYFSLNDVFDQIEESKEELSGAADQLDAMQEREYTLKKLYRKYGGSYESVMETRKVLHEKVDRILHRQDLFDRLEKERRQKAAAYKKAALALRASRQKVIEPLERLVEQHARDLMLEHCVFKIQMQEIPGTKDGLDEIQFMASMNPGQAPTTLRHSASGGELSRLMLALKVVFQAENGIGTLVFDEIDTGVSGKVALAMGSKMHALSENYQVLCITHLPSVAVWADDHYRVSKSTDGESTTTSVALLNEKEHEEELAIMASGSASPKAVESMRDLIAEIRHG